jgi:lysozyme
MPGLTLIKSFEACEEHRTDGRFDAYPDPGSADCRPWTIGWGSTGPQIVAGTIWTREQCDARFYADLVRYAEEVRLALDGAPTTQNQFDALVSFHYNTGAISRATLTRKHRSGDHASAGAEFARWVQNDGKVVPGLVRRRAAEAALYAQP